MPKHFSLNGLDVSNNCTHAASKHVYEMVRFNRKASEMQNTLAGRRHYIVLIMRQCRLLCDIYHTVDIK